MPARQRKRTPIQEELKELKNKLAGSLTAMTDLFKKWDHDGSGSIDGAEFRRAVKAMVPSAEDTVIDALFREYDFDHSGELSYREYVRYTLRDGLGRQKARISSLFKLWDVNSNGTVDKDEFQHACEHLGFKAPKSEIDALFDELDEDRSGELEYKEINRWLRMGPNSQPQPATVQFVVGDRRGGAEASKRARAKRYLMNRSQAVGPRPFPAGWRPAPKFIRGVSVVLPSSSRPPSPPPEDDDLEAMAAPLTSDSGGGPEGEAGAVPGDSVTPADEAKAADECEAAAEDDGKPSIRMANLDGPAEPAHGSLTVRRPPPESEPLAAVLPADAPAASVPVEQPPLHATSTTFGAPRWQNRGWEGYNTWVPDARPGRFGTSRHGGGSRVVLRVASERPATAPAPSQRERPGARPPPPRHRAPPVRLRDSRSGMLMTYSQSANVLPRWPASSENPLKVVGHSAALGSQGKPPRPSSSPSHLRGSRSLRAHVRAHSAAAKERDLHWWRSALAGAAPSKSGSATCDTPSRVFGEMAQSPSVPHLDVSGVAVKGGSGFAAGRARTGHRSAPTLLTAALENAYCSPAGAASEAARRPAPRLEVIDTG